ncbi:RhuM family protein [Pedobacter panaciterrae]|uniref:RhuM family protein n=1 Tax=Pedobacter panaciterrae TaxID=363849 RepID=A0ABU8NGX8_9SPHI
MTEDQIIIYQSSNGETAIDVKLQDETVWLTQAQMQLLFDQTKQNISLHINNIFKENELTKDAVVKESLTTAKDGKRYKVRYYSLDVIISIGYRIKSKKGTQFRIWANNVLKEYLIKGYAINQKRLKEQEKLGISLKVAHSFRVKLATQTIAGRPRKLSRLNYKYSRRTLSISKHSSA